MTDRPILFSGPMVRALLEGRKTQTRRVLKPEPYEYRGEWWVTDRVSGDCKLDDWVNDRSGIGPRFAIGDRLWVREAHAMMPRLAYRMSIGTGTIDQIEHPSDGYSAALFREGFDRTGRPRWRPSIHMPRWASRLTLTVTDVRVQRLQEISEADAMAEGVEQDTDGWRDYLMPSTQCCVTARDSFRTLWDSLNAKRGYSWDANPWVAAYSFTVHCRNIDQMEIAA